MTVVRGSRPGPLRSQALHGFAAQGSSSPLGATPGPEGTNFSVFSKHATGVELLLFEGARNCGRDGGDPGPDLPAPPPAHSRKDRK